MSQADNYTPQSVTGTTATLNVVLPWIFDGINELEITQTDGTTIAELENNDFNAFVVGQIVTVENFFSDGNTTTITVSRATKKTQEFTQTEFNPLDAEALNQALDKIVRMIQDTAFKSDFVFDSLTEGELRELLLTAITSDDPFDIPAKDYRKNVYLGFDQNGELILTVPEGVTPPDPPPNPEAFLTVLTDIKVVSGTTYTLLDSDTGKFIIFTNVADVTVTSPADLTLGHQVMYLKTAPNNEIIHVADTGAEHVNDIPVIASKQYAWYSHTVFENTGGNAAKYRFIGEIDTTDTNNIELVSRTITIIDGMTRADAQDLINTLGKYISAGVELKIVFEDTTSVNTQALLISDFTGPGILTIESLTPTPQDATTARPVNITNSNVPSALDYADPVDFENQLNWDSYLANSCMVISNNTCSQISIRGFSFSAKVFPVVMTGNTATMDIRYNFFNQINAFTAAQYDVAAGLKINGGMAYTYQNKYTTDTDTNGLLLHGCQIHLNEPAGEGGYLVKGGSGVAVAYDTGTFTPLIDLYEIDGFWSTDGQIVSIISQATETLIGGAKVATQDTVDAGDNDTDFITALKLKNKISQSQSIAVFEDRKAAGTAGGTFTAGSWQTRVLNTVASNDIPGASLSSNRITLQTGKYHFSIKAVALDVQNHKIRLRNITNGNTELVGLSNDLTSSTDISGVAICEGVLTITSQKVFEIQHRCSTTQNTDGFGSPSSFGVSEVYCICTIRKVG